MNVIAILPFILSWAAQPVDSIGGPASAPFRAARIQPVAFDQVLDTMNTMDERGQPLGFVVAFEVQHAADNPGLSVSMPQVHGWDRRDLLALKWDAESRRWLDFSGNRLLESTGREDGAIALQVDRADGIYGVFLPMKDPREASRVSLHFGQFEGATGQPSWRLMIPSAQVVVEGEGEAGLALSALPPNATLQVRWNTPSGPVEQRKSIHDWSPIKHRHLLRKDISFDIQFDTHDTSNFAAEAPH